MWVIDTHMASAYTAGVQMEFEQAEFSLAEAERITGVTTAAIRTWKRRGLLEAGGAYQKLTVFLLASLLLRRQLIAKGFDPAEARDVGDRFAADILYFAVLDTRGSCEVQGAEAAVQQFEEQFGEDDRLATQLSLVRKAATTTLVSVDGEGLKPATIEALTIDQDSIGGYYIHLVGLGRHLGAAARKPLFYIHLPTIGDKTRRVTRRVPRMTP